MHLPGFKSSYMLHLISWQDFSKIDMRVGTILTATFFKEAKKPSYILQIDFGELGIKKSAAQLTKLYTPDDLINRQIIAIVNFPPKQIATIMSECLVLGAVADDGEVTLLKPERNAKNGLRIG